MTLDIFFDLDGSLIDTTYRPNVAAVEFRRQLELLGPETKTHLNSNRSLVQLRTFYEEFGLNGYIILENGCCFFDPCTGVESTSCVRPFDRDKLRSSLELPVVFTSTDAVVMGQAVDAGDGPFVFAEPSRKYTMTLYPRLLQNSTPVKDVDLLQEVYLRVKNEFIDYEVSQDPVTYWNILLKPKGVLKSTLLPQLSRSERIASFGDSRDDICMFECSMFSGAPENASEDAKEAVRQRGGMVTPSPYTKGAMEFLGEIGHRSARW
jgi:hydroxymethylpyrimidine pyrophosphatase-like HAD family hydrolase